MMHVIDCNTTNKRMVISIPNEMMEVIILPSSLYIRLFRHVMIHSSSSPPPLCTRSLFCIDDDGLTDDRQTIKERPRQKIDEDMGPLNLQIRRDKQQTKPNACNSKQPQQLSKSPLDGLGEVV